MDNNWNTVNAPLSVYNRGDQNKSCVKPFSLILLAKLVFCADPQAGERARSGGGFHSARPELHAFLSSVHLCIFLFVCLFVWAAPLACGSSQARDQTCVTAVTQVAAVTTLGP